MMGYIRRYRHRFVSSKSSATDNMNSQKEKFYELLEDYIESLSTVKQESVCLSKDKYDKALTALELDKWENAVMGQASSSGVPNISRLSTLGLKRPYTARKHHVQLYPKEELYTLVKCHEGVGQF